MTQIAVASDRKLKQDLAKERMQLVSQVLT